MIIEKNKVVTIEYTLKNASDEIIDTSVGGQPLEYLHGYGMLIPGLEKELEGKGYLTEHQSLGNYYTKDEVDGMINAINDLIGEANDYITNTILA